MHGRVKVKTTAQQEAERQAERRKKLTLYKQATGRIYGKRGRLELDAELLQITAQVLLNNPDDATLWNIRRETFLFMKTKGKSVADLIKDELMLTQQALMKNPKSYGAWWHRGWINKVLSSDPDWARELQLTSLFLEKDDRNFHCWDYRRFVLERYPVPLEDELKFTREKIDSNFSNYSSWHYRSNLLPKIFPGDQGSTIQEDVLLEELDLVLNAAFTDPQDQSAWMYHRWLLGRVEPTEDATFKRWYVSDGVLLVNFGKEVSQCELEVTANGSLLEVEWKAVGRTESAFAWTCHHTALLSASTTVSVGDTPLTSDEPEWRLSSSRRVSLLTAAKSTVLLEQLANAKQLVQMEPDTKWPMLTTALLMCALQDTQYHDETIAILDSLVRVDPARKNYYHDLRSKIVIEHHLTPYADVVNLVGQKLTCLRHCDLMSAANVVNLADNLLQDRFLYQLRHCARLSSLTLDGNPIQSLDFLEVLPQSLKDLSIKLCDIRNVDGLRHCKALKNVTISSNLNPELVEAIRQSIPADVQLQIC